MRHFFKGSEYLKPSDNKLNKRHAFKYSDPLKSVLSFVASVFACVMLLNQPAHAFNETTYYHHDGLGSPVAATDAGGNLLWREDYRPYGERVRNATNANNNLWYTGKPEEPALGLQYFGARWYDPSIGRFTGVDPLKFREENIHSFNRYTYANNNPYAFIDPDGKDGVNVGLTLKALGEGFTNTISIRYPGITNEPWDLQLQTGLSAGFISSKIIGWLDPENPFGKQFGLELAKGTLNVGWDFASNEGSGVNMNVDGHAGWGMLGGTATVQNLMDKDAPPIPSSFEVNIGPQYGASISPELEFTTSARDVVNIVRGQTSSGTGTLSRNKQKDIE